MIETLSWRPRTRSLLRRRASGIHSRRCRSSRPRSRSRIRTSCLVWLLLLHIMRWHLLSAGCRTLARIVTISHHAIAVHRSSSAGVRVVTIMTRGGTRRWLPLHTGGHGGHGLSATRVHHGRRHGGGGSHSLRSAGRGSGAKYVGKGSISLTVVIIAVAPLRWSLRSSSRIVTVVGHGNRYGSLVSARGWKLVIRRTNSRLRRMRRRQSTPIRPLKLG